MMMCSTKNASINRRMSLGLTGWATCGLVRRFVKMPGMRMCPRLWPNLVQKCLFVPNGSPYARGKMDVRMAHMVARVVETGLPLVYVNMVGGQDDQVFDGGSFVLNPGGALALSLPLFEDCIAHVDFELTDQGWQAGTGTLAHWPDAFEQDYYAMVLSLRDYMRKTGFSSAVLGLSGGIDSAIVATIAADALGPQNVHCVMLPSQFTSQASLQDAASVAQALGAPLQTLPITGPQAAITESLAPIFAGRPADLTEENHPVSLARPVVDVPVQQVGAYAVDHGQ